jgi:hypothetical protein
VRAHRAAGAAATAGLIRRMPAPTTSPSRNSRLSRTTTPCVRRGRDPLGTTTWMSVSVRPVTPASCSAVTRSRAARGEVSRTATQRLAREESGPVWTARVCRPVRRHRLASTSRRTNQRGTRAATSWGRDTIPSCGSAMSAATTADSAASSHGCPSRSER